MAARVWRVSGDGAYDEEAIADTGTAVARRRLGPKPLFRHLR